MAESQARAAARERDKAAALASRNGAMNDFMSLLISEAAFSANPVTVSEMLARSEQLAMADSSENSEDRAAILGMIAAMINNGSGDSSRSVALLERALVLVAGSRDSNLRARLTCDHAHMTAMGDSGKSEAAARALKHALENPDLDPLVASECLADLSGLSQFTRDGPAAVRYAMQSLDRFHDAGRQPVVDEAALIGQLAYAYFLDGQNRQADHYYQKALQKYAEAGRNYHPAANVLMNNWALVSSSAGVPKRALELYERGLSFVRSNDPGARPPPIMVANRARVLETIGRYAQARDAYNLALRLTRESKLVNFEVSCLLGLAAIAERFGDRATARRYLSEASGLTAPSWPADYPAVLRRLVLEGSLDITDGKLERARAKFDQVLARKVKTQTTISAGLGRAEVDLLSGDTAAAVAHSQDALSLATSLQGGLPYSCYAGLSWLMRGRALQARGEVVQARKAYETAITHLSNTVDADHPELLRARQLLASSGGTR
jgi:tetratricopeptide (TPR) repeat protein